MVVSLWEYPEEQAHHRAVLIVSSNSVVLLENWKLIKMNEYLSESGNDDVTQEVD